MDTFLIIINADEVVTITETPTTSYDEVATITETLTIIYNSINSIRILPTSAIISTARLSTNASTKALSPSSCTKNCVKKTSVVGLTIGLSTFI